MENSGVTFDNFKGLVKLLGGVWGSYDVHFTQFEDGYGATYAPDWPMHSKEDRAITFNKTDGQFAWVTAEEYDKRYNEIGR